MPTKEAIVNTTLPQDVPKPIPVRVISTRTVQKVKDPAPAAQNADQGNTVRSEAADSATTADSVKLSPQLSALARKEQAFRQRELALKQREKDLEAKLAKGDQYDQLTTKLTAKDFSEAEKLGLDYDAYTKYKLDQQAGEDPQAQKLAALEAEIQALKKGQEESAAQSYEEVVASYRKEISASVANNPEFSSIKELKAEAHVLQLILDSFEEDKVEMTVEDACKDIENAFVEQAKKFSALPKFKPATPAVEEKKTLPPPKPAVNTLTNNMAASTAETKPLKPLQYLSESERYAEARRRVLARRQQQQGS